MNVSALNANPAAPALFVFDEPLLRDTGLSFKRLLFLYESALEAIEGRAGEIRRGAVPDEVLEFCRAHAAGEIHVTPSVAPRFRNYLAALREHLPVVVHEPPPLVDWRGEPPRRFSAFWRKVADQALRPTGLGTADDDV